MMFWSAGVAPLPTSTTLTTVRKSAPIDGARVVAGPAEDGAADDHRDDALEQVRVADRCRRCRRSRPTSMPTSAEAMALNANASVQTRRVLISEYSAARGFAPVASSSAAGDGAVQEERDQRPRPPTQITTSGGMSTPNVFVDRRARGSISHSGALRRWTARRSAPGRARCAIVPMASVTIERLDLEAVADLARRARRGRRAPSDADQRARRANEMPYLSLSTRDRRARSRR